MQPNAGIEAYYRKVLHRLIEEMQRSVLHHLSIAYRCNEPVILAMDGVTTIAMDANRALPARALKRIMDELAKRWQGRFDDLAVRLAGYFARSVSKRTDKTMARMLKKAGWTVDFKLTRAQRDVLTGVINENVSLIKSLPSECLTQVEGSVMRSVTAGYDLKVLSDDLRHHFGVTKKRAAFIADDQTKKTNAVLTRVRQVELGVQVCKWKHSAAGVERYRRPNHVRFGKEGATYDPAKGMWDPDADGKGKGRWVLPGQLIRCRCLGRPILPELSGRFRAEAA